MFPIRSKGGIEAALAQYDVTKQGQEHDAGGFPSVSRVSGIFEKSIIVPEETGGRSIVVSPLSVSMPFSLDRRNDGIRPSAVRLVAPEIISRATPCASRINNIADGLQSYEMLRQDSQQVSYTSVTTE